MGLRTLLQVWNSAWNISVGNSLPPFNWFLLNSEVLCAEIGLCYLETWSEEWIRWEWWRMRINNNVASLTGVLWTIICSVNGFVCPSNEFVSFEMELRYITYFCLSLLTSCSWSSFRRMVVTWEYLNYRDSSWAISSEYGEGTFARVLNKICIFKFIKAALLIYCEQVPLTALNLAASHLSCVSACITWCLCTQSCCCLVSEFGSLAISDCLVT